MQGDRDTMIFWETLSRTRPHLATPFVRPLPQTPSPLVEQSFWQEGVLWEEGEEGVSRYRGFMGQGYVWPAQGRWAWEMFSLLTS